jgi:ectoine hydroxylase-related dioxygenase (phytanoyl-CoA dioxygenase family)
VFVLLSDCDADAGAHEFVPGSHNRYPVPNNEDAAATILTQSLAPEFVKEAYGPDSRLMTGVFCAFVN